MKKLKNQYICIENVCFGLLPKVCIHGLMVSLRICHTGLLSARMVHTYGTHVSSRFLSLVVLYIFTHSTIWYPAIYLSVPFRATSSAQLQLHDLSIVNKVISIATKVISQHEKAW